MVSIAEQVAEGARFAVGFDLEEVLLGLREGGDVPEGHHRLVRQLDALRVAERRGGRKHGARAAGVHSAASATANGPLHSLNEPFQGAWKPLTPSFEINSQYPAVLGSSVSETALTPFGSLPASEP